MHTLLIISAVVGGLFILIFAYGFIEHRLHPDGYEATPQQIRAELQKIVDRDHPYAWDDFTTGGHLKDPRFEAIRRRVAQLDEEFPPTSKGQIFGDGGIEVIRGYIRELEHETAA